MIDDLKWVLDTLSVRALDYTTYYDYYNGAHKLSFATDKFRSAFGSLLKAFAPVRAALEDFCGSQNTLKGAIAAVQKRNATRAEKLLATGTGSTAAPASLTFEGSIASSDVDAALRL